MTTDIPNVTKDLRVTFAFDEESRQYKAIGKRDLRGNLRRYRTHGYTQIGNSVINDWTLSTRALAVFVRIQGLPDDWNFNVKGLVKTFATDRSRVDGITNINAAIAELEKKGYLIRARMRSENGTFASDTVYATIDDESIYDAVRHDMIVDGLTIITERPEFIAKGDENADFIVTGAKYCDKKFNAACVENRIDDTDDDDTQNPSTEPKSVKHILDVTRENAESGKPAENVGGKVENEASEQSEPASKQAPAREDTADKTALSTGETPDMDAKPQVGTKIGLTNIGETDPTLEVKGTQDNPPVQLEGGSGIPAGESAREGDAGADNEPAGSPVAVSQPNPLDGRMDRAVGEANAQERPPEPQPQRDELATAAKDAAVTVEATQSDAPANDTASDAGTAKEHRNARKRRAKTPVETEADRVFTELCDMARNKNLLRSEDGKADTRHAFDALLATGRTPRSIVSAWKAVNDKYEAEGKDERYFPQLARWLKEEAESMRKDDAASDKKRAKSRRAKKAIRFAIMEQEDPQLKELMDVYHDLSQQLEHGLISDKSLADEAYREAWDYFKQHDTGEEE